MKYLMLFLTLLALCSCHSEHQENASNVINFNARQEILAYLESELSDHSLKAFLNCKSNWDTERKKNEINVFWQRIGDLDSYESYIILESGNSVHRAYSGYFFGTRKHEDYAFASSRHEELKKHFDVDGFLRNAENYRDSLKSDSTDSTLWPLTCKYLAVKNAGKTMIFRSFSSVNVLNYQTSKLQGVEITPLEELIYRIESSFERESLQNQIP